jgi:cytoskeletal protein CcmA (bactofilin family)
MFSAKTSTPTKSGSGIGASNATPMSIKPVAPVETSRGNGKAMPSIISAQLTVKGDLTSDGDVQVDGNIQGDVRTHSLTIGETGSVNGSVTADTVLVAGTVNGQIHARAVTLVRSSRVQGDIWHESLAIEAGARFEGGCKRKNEGEPGGTTESFSSVAKPEAGDAPYPMLQS